MWSGGSIRTVWCNCGASGGLRMPNRALHGSALTWLYDSRWGRCILCKHKLTSFTTNMENFDKRLSEQVCKYKHLIERDQGGNGNGRGIFPQEVEAVASKPVKQNIYIFTVEVEMQVGKQCCLLFHAILAELLCQAPRNRLQHLRRGIVFLFNQLL